MGWMAWTWPTAAFFAFIAAVLITFSIITLRHPETPRRGILRIDTTRGDRVFITLLGSAYINLAWLGLALGPQPWALLVCAVYAVAVFRYV
jgi:predicted small integral membrane protein